MINFVLKFPSLAATKFISLYQATLSPDHGLFKGRYPYGFCRHYPSCSQYAKISIGRYGIIKGGFMGFVRILKCNPWVKPTATSLADI